MPPRASLRAATAAVLLWPLSAAQAGLPMAAILSPGQQCRAAIVRAERLYRLPPRLLGAIGRVESGRRGPDGRTDPWPYSINAEGTDAVFDSLAEAIAGVRARQGAGIRSIDIGCLQVNLMYHPDAFASLQEAFDPWRNADYAARFLIRLHDQLGSWDAATAAYHSATPELGLPYAARVRTAMASEGTPPALPDPGFATGAAAPFRGVALSLSVSRPGGGAFAGGATGRGLAAYRSAPVRLSLPLFRR